MKKKAPKGWVKISEYEKLIGISRKTISDAIRDGRIPAAYVVKVREEGTPVAYYIDPNNAAEAWLTKVNANRSLSKPIYTALSQFLGKGKKDVEVSTKMTLADAQLMERIAKARLAQLDCKQREKELVERAEVESSLFALAKELRDALLSIPDRIIDNIMAAETRTQGHRIMYDAIADELDRLSDEGIRKINETK